MTGVITAYNKQRGFGLISQEMVIEGIYFDIVDCMAKGLYIGSFVTFDIVMTKKGSVAKNIFGLPKLRTSTKPLNFPI